MSIYRIVAILLLSLFPMSAALPADNLAPNQAIVKKGEQLTVQLDCSKGKEVKTIIKNMVSIQSNVIIGTKEAIEGLGNNEKTIPPDRMVIGGMHLDHKGDKKDRSFNCELKELLVVCFDGQVLVETKYK
jgi:hypothetical protein